MIEGMETNAWCAIYLITILASDGSPGSGLAPDLIRGDRASGAQRP